MHGQKLGNACSEKGDCRRGVQRACTAGKVYKELALLGTFLYDARDATRKGSTCQTKRCNLQGNYTKGLYMSDQDM